MADGFEFVIKITGLVVLHLPGDGYTGSFLGVRSSTRNGAHEPGHSAEQVGGHSAHPHTAAFAYPPTALSGFNERPVRAPDPLFADAYGSLFARRVLEDEILWVEPRWEDDAAHLLQADVPNLLSLSKLDPRVAGIDESTLGSDLTGSPAIARLDVSAGLLTEAEQLPGPWQAREAGGDFSSQEEPFPELADALDLRFAPVRSVIIHSNKGPALRFASDADEVVVSYTVEPALGFVTARTDLLAHFEMAYNVVTWKAERPSQLRKPFLTGEAEAQLTIKDLACPPTKG